MQLSPHFSLAEFTRSEKATRSGISNVLPAELLMAAASTAVMLEKIRQFLGELAGHEIPITVTSGYRCIALNRALGSSDSSDHVRAAAVDWLAPAFGTPTEICTALAPVASLLGIGQLINEYPDRASWVHTSTREPDRSINRIITITGRGTHVGILGS